MSFLSKSMAFIFLSSVSLPATAWWDEGHQLVGEIAKESVTANTLKKVNELLAESIVSPGNEELSTNTNTLDTTASWADSIKSYKEQNTSQKYNSCHYINIPMTEDQIGQNIADAKVKAKLNTVLGNGTLNSVSCLKSALKAIQLTKNSTINKAIALRMTVHIIGDIGQPLHSVDFKLNGFSDRGGNNVIFNKKIPLNEVGGGISEQNKLHSIWDGTLGVFNQFHYNPADVKKGIFSNEDKYNVALNSQDILKNSEIINNIESNYINASSQSIENWVIDSYKIAVKFVYSDLNIQKQKSDSVINAAFSKNWETYKNNRNLIIQAQLAKSGLNLTETLNALFDKDKAKESYRNMLKEILEDDSIEPMDMFNYKTKKYALEQETYFQ